MQAIIQIALNTYRELIRGKVLYSLLFFAVALVLLTALFSSVTLGDQVKIIKDIGLTSISIFSVAMAVIAGSSLLNKELNKKTIYNILAKPVHSWQFLVGKQLGLMTTIGIMILIMVVGLSVFSYLFDQKMDLLLFEAVGFIFFELVIITAFAIFFSTVVITPMLSGLFTLSIFVAGRSIEYLPLLIKNLDAGILTETLGYLYWILPHLDKMNISNQIVYGSGTSLTHFFYTVLYSLSYAAIILTLAGLTFKRRDFN